MKKSELKNIIKECVKEVIFEEGVLSGIITEVAQGLTASPIVEQKRQDSRPQVKNQMREAKKRVLDSIGGSAYEEAKKKFSNPQLFEGTMPIPESGRGPLGGTPPGDPGVDISNIPGLGNWAAVASKTKTRK